MGIRVNKVMGYALLDVECDGYRISDPRINSKSPLLDWDVEGYDLPSFVRFLEERYQGEFSLDLQMLRDAEPSRHLEPTGSVVHDSEYGMKNVLLLRPLTMRDWVRYDDPLDWVEESYVPREAPQENWVRELPESPYPYSGSMIDVRSGDRFHHAELNIWLRLRNQVRDGKEVPLEVLDKFAEGMGFSSHEEAGTLLAPFVPEIVRDLADWGELFTDELVWTSLRPAVYTYWS